MIIIRADGNSLIGTGHIMRCRTIANELIKNGSEVIFVTADHSSDAILKDSFFEHIVLNTKWSELDFEIEKFSQILDKYRPSAVLVDSYFVTKEYLAAIRKKAKVAYIDDLNENVWPLDLLINYNIYSNKCDYSGYDNTKLLLGPSYIPLRDEFVDIKTKSINQNVKKILVSAGGADPEKITERIIRSIASCDEFKEYEFHFIIGALNKRVEDISNITRNYDNIILHINATNVSSIMQTVDLAISASGTTLYELCACGIPTITYVLADNQIIAAKEFDEQGLMVNIGDCRNCETFMYSLKNEIIKMFQNVSLRMDLSKNMQKLVDGDGAKRIAYELAYFERSCKK